MFGQNEGPPGENGAEIVVEEDSNKPVISEHVKQLALEATRTQSEYDTLSDVIEKLNSRTHSSSD